MMIKILVVSTAELGSNGITTVIMNYYRAMEKDTVRMDFLVGAGIRSEIKEELEASDSVVYEISGKQNMPGYMRKLRKLLEKEQYHIIHVHGDSAAMVFELLPAAKAGVPVRIAHSHNTCCKNYLLHKILNPLFQKSYTQAFACGEKAGEWLFRTKPYRIIPNGIDILKCGFSSELRYEYRRKIGAGNRKVIGHAGRFDSVKNQEFLVELAARLKDTDTKYLFLFIGEGSTRYHVREKADAYQVLDSVLFCGTVNDVHGYMAAMDLFVLPSLYEGFPVSLLEAQCSGLPCLVSDRVSKEADVTGLVKFLPLDRPEAWMESIQENVCYKNRNERSEYAKKEMTVKGYDILKSAETLKQLYEDYTGI